MAERQAESGQNQDLFYLITFSSYSSNKTHTPSHFATSHDDSLISLTLELYDFFSRVCHVCINGEEEKVDIDKFWKLNNIVYTPWE
jgi:predicted PolB exonuclease-like 3'-5' exonuclease